MITNLALESETLKHRKFVQIMAKLVADQNQSVDCVIHNLDTFNHTPLRKGSGHTCVF